MELREMSAEGPLTDRDLATVWVQSDAATQLEAGLMCRTIEGTVTRAGEAWNDLISRLADCSSSAHRYYPLDGILVDFDHYAYSGGISIEGDRVRVILLEQFGGTAVDYQLAVKCRNAQKKSLHGKWLRREITSNDLLESRGHERDSDPRFDQPLSGDALDVVWAEYIVNRLYLSDCDGKQSREKMFEIAENHFTDAGVPS